MYHIHWCSYRHLRLLTLLSIGLLYALLPSHTYARALPTLPAARPATVVQQSSFDCSTVTEIPQSECAALVDLYNSTNGPGWINQSGWLATPTPCSWFGVTCSGGHVIYLELQNNQLSGALPDSLGNLSGLIRLDLMLNQLSGAIPDTFGNLTSLLNLLLSNNQLSGTIPVALGNLTNLEQLYLYSNQLSGSIPPELGSLTNLQDMDLVSNQLTGSIPAAFGNLMNLTSLALQDNQLSGSIPPELGNLTSLQGLLLGSNQLTGSIPAALGNLTNLTTLWLPYNQLSGSIPPELGNLTNLTSLLLQSNPLNGPLPASLIQLTTVTDFAFNNTNLCEPTDAAFQSWLAAIANLQRTNVPCTDRLLSVHLLAFDNSAQNIDTNLAPQYQQVVAEALIATSGVTTKTVALLVDLDGVGDTHVVIIQNGAVVQLLGAPMLNARLAEQFAGWQLGMTPAHSLPNSSGVLVTPAVYEYDMADAAMLGGFLQWLFNTHIQDAAATQTLVSYIGHGAAAVPATDVAMALGIQQCDNIAYGQPTANGAIIPLPGGSVGAHPAFTDCHGRFNPATGSYHPTLLSPRSLAQALTTALNNSPVTQVDLLDLFHCFALSLEALAEFAGAENGGLPPAKQITGSPHYTYFTPEMIGRAIAQDTPAQSAAARAAALIQSYEQQLEQTVDLTAYPHLFVALDAAGLQPLLTAWEGVATRLYALLVDPQTQAATRAMIMTSYQNSAKYDTTYCAPQDWTLTPPDALSDLADFARLVQTSSADAALIDATTALLTQIGATIHQRIAGDGVPRGLHPAAQSLWTFADHAGIALYTDLAPMQITGYGRLRSWQSYWYHNGNADQPTPYRFTTQSQWDEALRLLWQLDDPTGAVMAAFCLPQLVLLPEEGGEKLDVAVDSLIAPTDESLPLMEPVYFKVKIATASPTRRYVDVRFQVMMNGEPLFEETVTIQRLLAAGDGVEVVTTQPWQPQTGGTATLTVMVDAADRLRETNEANNLLQQSYVIKPTDNTGVTVVEVWTDVDGAGNHGDIFAQGAPIHYTALTANTTGSTQVVPGTWSATGPCGAILSQSLPGWHIGAGTQRWYIHETVPLTACPGVYTLTTTIEYQGITSSQSRTFTVVRATGAIRAPNRLIARTLSEHQLRLTWVDRSDNESGFSVERCQVSSGTTCTTFAPRTTLGINSTTFTDSDLTPNTRYCYRLQGYNQNRVSAYSNVACRTTAPPAPSKLVAQALTLNRIKLTWADNAVNESGFKIERCQGPACTTFSQIATRRANITTLINGNLAANTTYCYRVRAYNANGNSSYSDSVCATNAASATGNFAEAATADESSFDPEGTTIAVASAPLQLQLPVDGQASIQYSLTCLDDAPASQVTLWVDDVSIAMQPDGAEAGRYQALLKLPTDFPTPATFPLVVRWQCAGEEELDEEYIGDLEYGTPTAATFQNRAFLPLALR